MIVNAVWIGERLPETERMCARSWLAHGHECRLWTYGPVEGVPDGVRLLDAAAVLPPPIHRYENKEHKGSPVLHANLWRYEFLWQLGGAVIDMDTLCVSNQEVPTWETVISSEGQFHPNLAFIQVPRPDTEFVLWCKREAWRRLGDEGARRVGGNFGPGLVRNAVDECKMWGSVVEPDVFCPFGWQQTHSFFEEPAPELPVLTIGVQLWSAVIRREHGNLRAPDGSLWARWRREYA